MMTEQILTLLTAERDRLNRAIEALQGPTKRKGRPRRNPLVADGAGTGGRRKARTAVQKNAQSERMKKYWANRKKQAKVKIS